MDTGRLRAPEALAQSAAPGHPHEALTGSLMGRWGPLGGPGAGGLLEHSRGQDPHAGAVTLPPWADSEFTPTSTDTGALPLGCGSLFTEAPASASSPGAEASRL